MAKKLSRAELETQLAVATQERDLWRNFAYDVANGRALMRSLDGVTWLISRPAAPSGGVAVSVDRLKHVNIASIEDAAAQASRTRCACWDFDDDVRAELDAHVQLGQDAKAVQILAIDEGCAPLVIPSRTMGYLPVKLAT